MNGAAQLGVSPPRSAAMSDEREHTIPLEKMLYRFFTRCGLHRGPRMERIAAVLSELGIENPEDTARGDLGGIAQALGREPGLLRFVLMWYCVRSGSVAGSPHSEVHAETDAAALQALDVPLSLCCKQIMQLVSRLGLDITGLDSLGPVDRLLQQKGVNLKSIASRSPMDWCELVSVALPLAGLSFAQFSRALARAVKSRQPSKGRGGAGKSKRARVTRKHRPAAGGAGQDTVAAAAAVVTGLAVADVLRKEGFYDLSSVRRATVMREVAAGFGWRDFEFDSRRPYKTRVADELTSKEVPLASFRRSLTSQMQRLPQRGGNRDKSEVGGSDSVDSADSESSAASDGGSSSTSGSYSSPTVTPKQVSEMLKMLDFQRLNTKDKLRAIEAVVAGLGLEDFDFESNQTYKVRLASAASNKNVSVEELRESLIANIVHAHQQKGRTAHNSGSGTAQSMNGGRGNLAAGSTPESSGQSSSVTDRALPADKESPSSCLEQHGAGARAPQPRAEEVGTSEGGTRAPISGQNLSSPSVETASSTVMSESAVRKLLSELEYHRLGPTAKAKTAEAIAHAVKLRGYSTSGLGPIPRRLTCALQKSSVKWPDFKRTCEELVTAALEHARRRDRDRRRGHESVDGVSQATSGDNVELSDEEESNGATADNQGPAVLDSREARSMRRAKARAGVLIAQSGAGAEVNQLPPGVPCDTSGENGCDSKTSIPAGEGKSTVDAGEVVGGRDRVVHPTDPIEADGVVDAEVAMRGVAPMVEALQSPPNQELTPKQVGEKLPGIPSPLAESTKAAAAGVAGGAGSTASSPAGRAMESSDDARPHARPHAAGGAERQDSTADAAIGVQVRRSDDRGRAVAAVANRDRSTRSSVDDKLQVAGGSADQTPRRSNRTRRRSRSASLHAPDVAAADTAAQQAERATEDAIPKRPRRGSADVAKREPDLSAADQLIPEPSVSVAGKTEPDHKGAADSTVDEPAVATRPAHGLRDPVANAETKGDSAGSVPARDRADDDECESVPRTGPASDGESARPRTATGGAGRVAFNEADRRIQRIAFDDVPGDKTFDRISADLRGLMRLVGVQETLSLQRKGPDIFISSDKRVNALRSAEKTKSVLSSAPAVGVGDAGRHGDVKKAAKPGGSTRATKMLHNAETRAVRAGAGSDLSAAVAQALSASSLLKAAYVAGIEVCTVREAMRMVKLSRQRGRGKHGEPPAAMQRRRRGRSTPSAPQLIIRDKSGMYADVVRVFSTESRSGTLPKLHLDAPRGISPFTPKHKWERYLARRQRLRQTLEPAQQDDMESGGSASGADMAKGAVRVDEVPGGGAETGQAATGVALGAGSARGATPTPKASPTTGGPAVVSGWADGTPAAGTAASGSNPNAVPPPALTAESAGGRPARTRKAQAMGSQKAPSRSRKRRRTDAPAGGGYCEWCNIRYTNLDDHIVTSKHESFAARADELFEDMEVKTENYLRDRLQKRQAALSMGAPPFDRSRGGVDPPTTCESGCPVCALQKEYGDRGLPGDKHLGAITDEEMERHTTAFLQYRKQLRRRRGSVVSEDDDGAKSERNGAVAATDSGVADDGAAAVSSSSKDPKEGQGSAARPLRTAEAQPVPVRRSLRERKPSMAPASGVETERDKPRTTSAPIMKKRRREKSDSVSKAGNPCEPVRDTGASPKRTPRAPRVVASTKADSLASLGKQVPDSHRSPMGSGAAATKAEVQRAADSALRAAKKKVVKTTIVPPPKVQSTPLRKPVSTVGAGRASGSEAFKSPPLARRPSAGLQAPRSSVRDTPVAPVAGRGMPSSSPLATPVAAVAVKSKRVGGLVRRSKKPPSAGKIRGARPRPVRPQRSIVDVQSRARGLSLAKSGGSVVKPRVPAPKPRTSSTK